MRTKSPFSGTRPFGIALLAALVAAVVYALPAAAERPGFYSAPSIVLGDAKVGAVLIGSDGSLRCEPKCESAGPEPERAGIFFQWLSCAGAHGGGKYGPPGGLPDEGGPCPGAAVIQPSSKVAGANAYTLRPSDAGRYIQLEVIGINYDCGEVDRSTGKSECRYSEGHGWSSTKGPIAPLGPPPPPPPPPVVSPANTALPVITGVVEDMQALAVSAGTWSGTAPLALVYRWLRCSTALKGCQEIDGATEASYTATGADVGARLTATVTASNAAGSAHATAKVTQHVAGAVPRPGNDSLKVSQLLPRHRLVVGVVTFTPIALRPGARWTGRVVVTDRRGFLIKGVQVTIEDELGEVTS
ncbi:MAG: hypothetical protein ACRDNX_14830, partial [Gaiellaceae bacterium]